MTRSSGCVSDGLVAALSKVCDSEIAATFDWQEGGDHLLFVTAMSEIL